MHDLYKQTKQHRKQVLAFQKPWEAT